MKWMNIRLFFFILIFLTNSFSYAATENYTLDPQHTYVLWHISHFGFSNPSGKWMAEGTLTLDQTKPQNSKVSATVPVKNVITGIPELDKHLQSALFFDVEKFPTATFVSNKITLTGKQTADVQGILTLHGISKPITLHVKLNKIGENPISNKMSVGFSATTEIKRSDFGINTLLPGLSDTVMINIEAEASKVVTFSLLPLWDKFVGTNLDAEGARRVKAMDGFHQKVARSAG